MPVPVVIRVVETKVGIVPVVLLNVAIVPEVALNDPSTSSFADGFVVPIPTLPRELILIASVSFNTLVEVLKASCPPLPPATATG